MKKQLYIKTTISRSNPVKTFLLGLFTLSVSMPRKLCETFSRSQFGERYYSFAWAIIYTLVLIPVPIVKFLITHYDGSLTSWDFLSRNLTWYVFLWAFIYKAFMHWKEMKREASTFDFERFSLAGGVLDERIAGFKYKGKELDWRIVETIIEPGFFFLVGLGLILLGQTVGFLIFSCSIFYSASRFLDYANGDEIVLDYIDQAIINKYYKKSFVDDIGPKQTKGFQFRSGKPTSKVNREKVADGLLNDDDGDSSYAV